MFAQAVSFSIRNSSLKTEESKSKVSSRNVTSSAKKGGKIPVLFDDGCESQVLLLLRTEQDRKRKGHALRCRDRGRVLSSNSGGEIEYPISCDEKEEEDRECTGGYLLLPDNFISVPFVRGRRNIKRENLHLLPPAQKKR